MIWHFRDRRLDLAERPRVMGVLNVTPDSFSDGGRFLSIQDALGHATQMVSEGADLIDVGAESTRPGSEPVSAALQIERACPVIAYLRRLQPDLPISIDTRNAAVAQAALEAGAEIINDVSSMNDDPAMATLAARTGAGLILMHMRGRPETKFTDPATGLPPVYHDVISEIADYLRERMFTAMASGILHERVVLDPGIGFGKDTAQNLEILRRLPELAALGRPVMVGASRKRFIGNVLGQEKPEDRLYGSLACVAAAILAGARVVRVHDVASTVQVARMCSAIQSSASTSVQSS